VNAASQDPSPGPAPPSARVTRAGPHRRPTTRGLIDVTERPPAPAPSVSRAQRLAALDAALPLLACPVCACPLVRNEAALVCPSRHRFDIARAGYVNLFGRATPANADTAAMVAAREAFLGTGAYEPIAEAVRGAVIRHGGLARAAGALVEVGAGPGYYLRHVATGLPAETVCLASDISVDAARRAAATGIASIVADTWSRLPLGSAGVDVVLTVFAPRNAAEIARIVRPGGCAIVVTPMPDHLADMRERLALMRVHPDAGPRAREALRRHGFEVSDVRPLAYRLRCTAAQQQWLVEMGPNAFHPHAAPESTSTLIVSVEVSVAVRQSPGPTGG